MKQINRWVLSCQNRVVNVWYNQDHTVYGLNPTAGPQQPDNSNTVTVYDLGSGLIALQCPANPGAGIPAAFAWFTNEYSEYGTNLRFQYPWDGWVTQDYRSSSACGAPETLVRESPAPSSLYDDQDLVQLRFQRQMDRGTRITAMPDMRCSVCNRPEMAPLPCTARPAKPTAASMAIM